MGNAVSTGKDNDELIDNLINENFLTSTTVKRVFRAVDRAEYILPQHRTNAYRDQAWRCKHLHLSAPCIYAKVMEALCLKPGLSFLNLGSGTGYLSTMVGLVLGSKGINHGVELHDDVIQYAKKKLEDFKRYSGAMDEFDFCEPKFIQGNCMNLSHDFTYDRIYVGAACPQQKFLDDVRGFLKEDGILVMPYKNTLLQMRKTKNSCKFDDLLPVSFATLIPPDNKNPVEITLDPPESLQSLCRSMIRQILREKVNQEEPTLTARHNNRELSTPDHHQKGTKPCLSAFDGELIAYPDARNYPVRVVWTNANATSIASDNNTNGHNNGGPAATSSGPHFSDDEVARKKIYGGGLSDEEASEDDRQRGGQIKRTKLTVIKRMYAAGDGGEAERPSSSNSTSSNSNNNNSNSSSSSSSSDDTSYSDYKESDDSDSSISSVSCLTDSSESLNRRCWDDEEEETEDGQQQKSGAKVRKVRRPLVVASPFTKLMCAKIDELPLPVILKSYLSYDRL